eukprot:9336651-Heterocapsa_arctica.AAC.1
MAMSELPLILYPFSSNEGNEWVKPMWPSLVLFYLAKNISETFDMRSRKGSEFSRTPSIHSFCFPIRK